MTKRWLKSIPLEDLVTELGYRGFVVSQTMPVGLTKEKIKIIDELDKLANKILAN